MKHFQKLVVISAVALLGLSGCQTAKPIAMTVTATPTVPGTQHGDVLARQRAEGQDIPALQGQEVVTLRTYEYSREADSLGATRAELEGTACVLESEGYRAEVKTPAQVSVPDYGYASRPIRVNCSAPGFRTSHATLEPFSRTSANRMDSAQQSGLAGVLIVALVDAASDRKTHDFGYRPAEITMNRIGCEAKPAGCR